MHEKSIDDNIITSVCQVYPGRLLCVYDEIHCVLVAGPLETLRRERRVAGAGRRAPPPPPRCRSNHTPAPVSTISKYHSTPTLTISH